LIYLKRCGAGACGGHGFKEQIFGADEQNPGLPSPPMKWEHYPNLRRRPATPSKGRGPIQVRIRRSTQIYAWTHPRRRLGRRKPLPDGTYWGTLQE
jgi:hypothetical protein